MPSTTVDLLQLLAALTSDDGHGELILQSPEGAARVFLHAGKIAWATIEDDGPRFTHRLIAAGVLKDSEVDAAVAECRRTGENFCEKVIAWGFAERELMRELLREYVRAAVERAAGFSALHGLFVPQKKKYSSSLTFSLQELWPHREHARGPDAVQRQASQPDPSVVAARGMNMANVTDALADAMAIDGAIAAALVDCESGKAMGTAGGGPEFDVHVAAAGNTEVVRAKMRVARSLNIPGSIEDILVTLTPQYHLMRPLARHDGLFLYLALDRAKANLALARFRLQSIEGALTL